MATSPRPHPRGTTLAETVIFAFLMSILSTAVIAVYVLCMRYMRITQASCDLQASAQRAMTAMTNDLADTTPSTVTPVTKGISFATARDSKGVLQPGPTWQAWVGYYIDGSNNLIKVRIPFTPTTTAPTNPYTTTSALMAASGTRQLVATNETDLDFTGIGQGSSLVGINGTFTLSGQGYGDCQIQISGYKVRPRN